jgi:hypothetical protein
LIVGFSSGEIFKYSDFSTGSGGSYSKNKEFLFCSEKLEIGVVMGWYVLITKGQNRGEIGYIIDPLTLNSVKTISIAETCLKLGINYTVEHITLCGQEHGSIVIISELEIIQIQIKDFIEEYTIKNDDIFSKYSQKWKYNKLLQQKIKLENRDTTVSPLQIQENIINE